MKKNRIVNETTISDAIVAMQEGQKIKSVLMTLCACFQAVFLCVYTSFKKNASFIANVLLKIFALVVLVLLMKICITTGFYALQKMIPTGGIWVFWGLVVGFLEIVAMIAWLVNYYFIFDFINKKLKLEETQKQMIKKFWQLLSLAVVSLASFTSIYFMWISGVNATLLLLKQIVISVVAVGCNFMIGYFTWYALVRIFKNKK